MLYSTLFMLVFVLQFCFVYSVFLYCFGIALCTVSPFLLSLSYFCTSLLTTATGWKTNCSK